MASILEDKIFHIQWLQEFPDLHFLNLLIKVIFIYYGRPQLFYVMQAKHYVYKHK
jgi:hypothetical protein